MFQQSIVFKMKYLFFILLFFLSKPILAFNYNMGAFWKAPVVASGGTTTAPATCPTGYISVTGNATLSTNGFCVMQFEARNSAGAAVSNATVPYYIGLTATQIQAKCAAITKTGSFLAGEYALISNPEWMTIARDIESVVGNFTAGVLSRGWSNISNTVDAPLSSCVYNSGVDTCSATGSANFKRTHTLTNSSIIWDFAGNLYERVDWMYGTNTNSGFTLGPSPTINNYTSYELTIAIPSVISASLVRNDYAPLNLSYNSANGMGKWKIGPTTGGGYTVRGGRRNDGAVAGIYSMLLLLGNATSGGFRCVYRPTPYP